MSTRPKMSRKGKSINQVAAGTGLSRATVARYTSVPRSDWERQQFERRERIRAYHDDEGHTWPETGAHFGTSAQNVKLLAYRARKERAEEAAREKETLAVQEGLTPPPLPGL